MAIYDSDIPVVCSKHEDDDEDDDDDVYTVSIGTFFVA